MGQFKINRFESDNGFFIFIVACKQPPSPEKMHTYVYMHIHINGINFHINGKLEEYLLNKQSIIRKNDIFKIQIALLILRTQ